MPSLELLACAVLIATSAFLSSSEIALFSLSRFQLRGLKDQIKPSSHRQLKRLLQDPGGLLITILVLNEVVNVAISSLITRSIAAGMRGPGGADGSWIKDLLAGTAVTTAILLLACEVTPKIVGAKANRLIAAACARPITALYELMKPARLALTQLVSILSHRQSSPILKESEFLQLIEEGQREGAVQQTEVELIKNVFELDDTRVGDVLTPLPQVRTIATGTTIKAALAMMRGQRYSRIPVTTANRRQIVGILYTKDMLRAKLEQEMLGQPVSELMRKPLVVGPSMQLNAVFRRFKQHRTHMAVVRKASGETVGIITMNDVLESLFSELFPDAEEEG